MSPGAGKRAAQAIHQDLTKDLEEAAKAAASAGNNGGKRKKKQSKV